MGFALPHVTILIATGAAGLALVLQIIGLATPYWISGSGFGYDINQGLWRGCSGDICGDLTGESGWYDACRAFGVLGMLLLVASLAFGVLSFFMGGRKIIPLVALATAGAAAFCILIEFAVFAGESKHSGLDYDYSFGVTIVACLLAVTAAVLFFLGANKTAAAA